MDNNYLTLDLLIERLKSSEYTQELIYLLNRDIQDDGKLPMHKAHHVIHLLEKIAYNPVKSLIVSKEQQEEKKDSSEEDNGRSEEDNGRCDCEFSHWRIRMHGCDSSKCEYYKDYIERLNAKDNNTEEERKINDNK